MFMAFYGAQGYALGAYEALKTLYPRRAVLCFLVTEMGGNPQTLGGIPVKEIALFSEELSDDEKQDVEILIATPESVQPEIEETLENYGFSCYRRLDSRRWYEWMKLYHARLGMFQPLSALPVGYHIPFIRIYMAKSHADRPLRDIYHLPEYVFPVQAGAGCSDMRIADLTDNSGNNISQKNVNYSELTVLYWIWKNKLETDMVVKEDSRQYYGLIQYRRIFDFDADDLLRLVDNDVDVVLPYPLPYESNIHAHHKRYLAEDDWNTLLVVLKEQQPEYAEAFAGILGQRYLYNYNVILARKNVLKTYCEWLFPLLDEVQERSNPKGCERHDRYIGYMGETLETLYFMFNRKKLNITHAGCKLLT